MHARHDVTQYVRENTVFVDHESRTLDTDAGLAVFNLLGHHAVEVAHRAVCVTQKRERELIAVTKIAVACLIVVGDTVDAVAQGLKVFDRIAEILRLCGSPRRIVFRVKVKNHLVPAKL